MATTTQSKKARGRVLQKEIVKRILKTFPQLTDRDVKSTSMGKPGEDVELSQRAAELFPYSVEAKNQEAIRIWDAIRQAESQNRGLTPLVVFKRNRSDLYCTMRFDDLLYLLKELNKLEHLAELEEENG